MEMKNEQHLPLPRETVWEALNDPAVLQACIPGCESLEKTGENAYDATVNAKVGPVKAKFKGRVTLTELNPPVSYTMSFEGQGGQAGFAKGEASVQLDETDGGTRVGYVANAQVGGKLAQLGSRLVKGAAEKTANEFFENFVRHMGGGEAGAEPAGEAAEGTGEAGPAAAAAGGQRPWAWVVAAVVVVVVVLLFTL